MRARRCPARRSTASTGNFLRPFLDDSGRIAFAARADPVGSTGSGRVGIWSGTVDDFDLVLLEGAAAPGAPEGVRIHQFRDTLVVNADGMVAFTATLAGSGVNIDNNDALFAGVPGDLRLIVREGDYMEVGPDDVRQVRLIRFGTPQQHEYLLNESDQVVAWIRFADRSDAIYKVTVPEPAGLPVLAAALLLLPRRRRLGAAGVHGA